jgi:membrane protease YdiL (CAAX protease family)
MFGPLFVIGGIGAFDFFWWMAANALVLTSLVAGLDGGWRRALREDVRQALVQKILLGLVSAAVLYGVFWVGNLASRAWFGFAAEGIDAIYGLKADTNLVRVGLLIGLVIGPAEELFWRGFVQRRLMARYGPWAGLLLATAIYTGMHVGSLNPMLLAAAAVCGLFWGLAYLRTRSLVLVVVSHLVWDLVVFLILPFA